MSRSRSLLAGWVVATLVFAALDVARTRLAFDYRPHDPALAWQAVLLWGVLGLVMLPTAWAADRVLTRRRGAPLPAWGTALLGASAAISLVAVHFVLARHVGLGGDLDAFTGVAVWVELASLGLVAGALAWAAFRFGGLVPWRWTARVTMALALVALVVDPVGPRARAASEASDAADRPNVLLMVWDTCRADRLVPYRYDRETTPRLAEFAEEAVVYEEARSVAAFTFTSHASMLTGTYPTTHGARMLSSVLDPRRAESVAQRFRDAGYRTGGFVGTSVLSGRTGIRVGFDHYDDQVDPPVTYTSAWAMVNDLQVLGAMLCPCLRNDGNPHWFQDFQRPASEVLEHAAAWIDRDDARPWFAMVNLYDVHWPYVPEGDGRALVRPYDGPVDGHLFRSDDYPAGHVPTVDDARHVSDLYEAELYDLDREVDGFFERLGLERGDTAVLLTSDHGEAFGEGGEWMHDDILEPQVRVPFLVRPAAPSPAGGRVTGLVTGADVAPTLLGLAGLAPTSDMEGQDLTRAVPDPDRTIRVEDRDHLDPDDVRVAVYRGWWKYLELGPDGGEARLYDLRTDPIGLVDVLHEHPEVGRTLAVELQRSRAARPLEIAGPSGRATTDALQALGYVGR